MATTQRLIRSSLRLRLDPCIRPQRQPQMSTSFFHWTSRPTTRLERVSEFGHTFLRSYSFGYHYGVDPGPKLMVIKTIIGLNAAVFGLWAYARATSNQNLWMTMLQNFTISLVNINAGRYWTGLTSAISHMSLAHLAFNMFTFNSLAKVFALTPGISTLSFVTLCVGSAAAGSAAWVYDVQRKLAGRPLSAAPDRSALGASGMVMGVVAAAACLVPFASISIMFIPVGVPLWATTLLYAGVDVFFINSDNSMIGHAAHLGGGAFGILYYFAFLRKIGGVAHMLGRGGSRLRH